MPSTPPVSVVMGVFNGERYLRECVDSILSQTFRDFEFIIIDDGSADGTAAILESFAQNDARVRVYHQENRGHAESLNRGCGLARGKYIARMDADDIALSDRLRRQIDFLENHDEVGVLSGAFEFIDPNGKTLQTQQLPVTDDEIRSRLRLRNGLPLLHPGIVMRREVFQAVGGYRRAFEDAEDYDLWVRMGKECQFSNLEAVLLRYRLHPDQVSCRKLRTQTLGALAASVLAASGVNGWQERLGTLKQITPQTLTALGISEATVERAIAASYRVQIDTMCYVGQQQAALRLTIDMLCSSRWEQLGKRMNADIWLKAAGLYWGQHQYLQSFTAAGRAVMVRPIVAGRPIKRILDRLAESFGMGKPLKAAGTD